jgi:hypothetical protein
MRRHLLISAVLTLGVVLTAAESHAQVGSSCLRPLGIPDKWIEMQTPPWDPTDTFDPTGANPDLYYDGWIGFDTIEDQGRPMSLVLYDGSTPLQGQSALPIEVGDSGSFHQDIVACSGSLHHLGQSFPTFTGSAVSAFGPAIRDLIDQDRDATWDPAANGGRGGVINSALPQSPRIIALPVFAPNTYEGLTATSPAMVKIVGFFISELITSIDGDTVHGYLTGWSQLAAPPVTARFGEWAQLSATFSGPGSPISGLALEFVHDGVVVATAETDGTGTARPGTTAFLITAPPGDYPGAIRVRIRESSSLFVADEAVADLMVLKKLPVITWLPPADITYGTPLGPAQLNAVADVPGEFTYTPAAGAVLAVTQTEPATLAVTFVPAEQESKLYDQATATTYITVVPRPTAATIQALTASPTTYGQTVSLTIAVSSGLGAPGGTVTLLSNGVPVAAATLVSGQSSISVSSLDAGSHALTAQYSGSGGFAGSSSPAVVHTVNPASTSTALTSSLNPSRAGQAVTFTATVNTIAPGLGTPAGSVEFLRNGSVIGAGPLTGGTASLTISTLTSGKHAIQARYVGTGNHLPSVSAVVQQSVKGGGK